MGSDGARVRIDGTGTPESIMATDAAMLAAQEAWIVRLYGWAPHGLSLGRFQRPEDFTDVSGDHRIVRRITGGGAIYHAREITFALAYDADLMRVSLDESYKIVHLVVRDVLAGFGVRTELVTEGKGCSARPHDRWCFATPGRNDLVTPRGHKIVGSAQRRIRTPRDRVLHHGSLVLETPAQTPFCGAVAEQASVDTVEPVLTRRLATALAALFAATP